MTIRKITGATSSLVAKVSVVTGNRIFINKATVSQTNLLATVAQDANVFKSNLILPGTVDHILYSDEGSSRFFRNLLYTADGNQLLISKNFFEPLDLLELVSRQTFIYNAQRKVDDTLLSEEEILLVFASARNIFDTLAITDRAAKLWASRKVDVFTMLDGGIRRYINSNKRETIAIGSGLAQRSSTLESITFLNTKLLRETSTIADLKQLAVFHRRTETVTSNDYRQTNYWLNKYFGDTAPALDLVGVFDGNIFSFSHLAFEALNISEDSRRILTANRRVNELLTVSENKNLLISKPVNEQLYATELVRKLTLQNKFEDQPTLDLPRQLFIKPADNLNPARVTVSEVFQPLPLLGRFETLTAAQTRFNYLYSKPVNDAISILDLIDGYTIAWTARRIFNELMSVAEQKAVILALQKNDAVAIGDLFGSALIKIRNENDSITIAEAIRQYMRMSKFDTANIDDPKAFFFRQGTRREDIAIGDVAFIARVKAFFETLAATDSRLIFDILTQRQDEFTVPDANYFLLNKSLGDVSGMLDFAATGDGAEFKFLLRTNDLLTILDFLDDTRLIFRARRTFREGIFPDDYFARNFWISKIADTVVPALVTPDDYYARNNWFNKTADTVVPAEVTIGDYKANNYWFKKTADAAVRAEILLGSGLDQRQSDLELISFVDLKTVDTVVPATVTMDDYRANNYWFEKTADAVVPATVTMGDYRTTNFWINKGLADTTTMLDLTGIFDGLNFLWIDRESDFFFAHSYGQVSATYIRAPRDGFRDTVTNTDRDAFFIDKVAYTRSATRVTTPTVAVILDNNAALSVRLRKFSDPLDLENADQFRRLTRTFLKPADGLRQDIQSISDVSGNSPYPDKVILLSARLGVNQTVSGITTTASTKTHPVFVGQRYGSIRFSGDPLERLALVTLKETGLGGAGSSITAISLDNDVILVTPNKGFNDRVLLGSGIDSRATDLETVSFVTLMRAELDQGSRSRFDPAVIGDNGFFSTYPARLLIKQVQQGADTVVSGVTIKATSPDTVTMGTYIVDSNRLSGDSKENLRLLIGKNIYGDGPLMLDSADIADGLTYTGILGEQDRLLIGSGLNQRASNLELVAFTVQLDAKQGVNRTVSGTTVTARDRDRVFTGQQYTGIYRAGDALETVRNFVNIDAKIGVTTAVLLKTADGINNSQFSSITLTYTSRDQDLVGSVDNYTNQIAFVRRGVTGVDTSLDTGFQPVLVLGSGLGQRQSDLERIAFTSLIRAKLDQGSRDRFDPAIVGSGILGIRVAGNSLENLAVTALLDAKQGVNTAVSGTTVTARDGDRLFVGQRYGDIRFSGDPMERISFLTAKLIGDTVPMLDLAGIFDGITYTSILIERDFLSMGPSADQTIPARTKSGDAENIAFTVLVDARRHGFNVTPFLAALATTVSGTTVTARDGDRVFTGQRYGNIRFSGDPMEALAFVTLKNTGTGGAGSSLSIVTLGSGFDQRQSTLERISFIVTKLIGDVQPMLDLIDVGDGATFTYLQRETDSFTIGTNILGIRVSGQSSENIRYTALLTARVGLATTFSSQVTTADSKFDPIWIGTTIGIRTVGDAQENVRFFGNKALLDVPLAGSGIDQRQSTLERISFIGQLRVKLDDGSFDRFDPAPALDNSAFSPYPARTLLLDAKAGAVRAVSGTTVTARDRDRLFVGQQYGTIRFSGDPQEALAFVTLKETGRGGAGSSNTIVTLGSGIDQRQSNLERISYIDIKRLSDTPVLGFGDLTQDIRVSGSALEQVSFTSLIRAKLDQGSRDRFDPAQPIDQTFKFLNLTAKRGFTGPVLLNTIDPSPDVEYQQSSVTITRTAWDVDEVGSLDRFNLTLVVNRFLEDYPLFGSGIDQRQSDLERISFLMRKLIGDTVPMLDLVGIFDGNIFTSLIYKADTVSMGPSVNQPYPARALSGNAENIGIVNLLTAKRGQNGTVFTQTIDGVNASRTSVLVSYGSYGDDAVGTLDFRTDVVNYVRRPHHGFADIPTIGDDSASSTFPARSLRKVIYPNAYAYVTNLLVWSESLGGDGPGEDRWIIAPGGGVFSANYVTAPDGTQTADRATGTYIYLAQDVSPNTTYTWSWYAQVIDDRLTVIGSITPLYYKVDGYDGATTSTLVASTLYSSGFTPYAWNRISVTFTTGPGQTIAYLYPYGNSVDGASQPWDAYYWGWQLNTGTTADAYIRTTSAVIINGLTGTGLSNFVAPTDTGARSNFVNISARRGVSGTLQFSTIGNSTENTVSSVTIVQTLRDPDAVGILDSFALFATDKNFFPDFVTIGSGLDQRQSALERVSFVIITRIKTDDGLGLALDPVAPAERIALQVLNRESSTAVVIGTTSGSRIAGNALENIRFTNLLTAKRGQNGTVFTQTIDGNNSARTSVSVIAGSYGNDSIGTLDFRTDVVNYIRRPHHGFDDSIDQPERPFLSLRLLARLDDGSFGRLDPVSLGPTASQTYPARVKSGDAENIALTLLVSAKRGVQGTVLLNTIDPNPDVEYQQSSVLVTYGSRQPDSVGTLDYFQLLYATNRFIQDSVLLGSGIDQRQSNLERISYFISKRFDETPAGGQGINVGPAMLDSFSFNDGLTFTYLQRETDAAPATDASAFSPYPARLVLLPARLGVVQTFSSITTTIDRKNHPVYVGQQYTGIYRAGDALETIRNYVIKTADSGDRSTAVSLVTAIDPARPPQVVLKRAVQDSDTFDRFDPAPALDTSTFSPYPARAMLLDAKRGLTAAVELKTIDSFGDNAYSSVQITYTSRDRDIIGSIDRALLTFTAGRILEELVTIGSGIDRRHIAGLERINFFIDKRFDETSVGGQGTNIGPVMLDAFTFNDGLTFTYLQNEIDNTAALDTSAFSPYPQRLLLLPARRGAVTAVSGTTVTADAKVDPVYVGSQITGTRYLAGDGLETLRNYLIKVADNGDRDTAVSIVTPTDPDFAPKLVLKRAIQDSGTFDRFDPAPALDNSTFSPYPARAMLLDAKRGLTGNVELKTLDSFGDNAYSSVQITYTSRDRDLVGSIDRALLTFTAGRILEELVTIGSGIDQRQNNAERISYFINKRFDENQDYGQGQNLGPLMLDSFNFGDGLTLTYLQRETDALVPGDTSAFSPFPARLMIMSARRGLVTAVSGTTTTADTKNDPVYAGTQITGTRYLAGDGLETVRNYLFKVADNGDRDTAISVVTITDPDFAPKVMLKRAIQDSGTFDRFDPAPALDTSTFSPFPQRLLLLDAKRGLTAATELKLIDSFGDNAYSSVQVTYTSRDRDLVGSIDRALLTFTAGRILEELVTIGSGIDQRQSNLERISFFIGMRFDETQDYGQGSNLGPLMLDSFNFGDGLTLTYLQRETEAVTAGTSIAIRVSGTQAENISFVNLLTAKAGLTTTVSSVNNTAASTDRLFIGQQYGNIRFSGDPLERLFFTMSMPESDVATPEERPFLSLRKTAKLDDGTNQTSHTVTIGTSSLGIRVSGQTAENISIQWLKTARRGVAGNLIYSTIGSTLENTVSSVTVVRTADSLGDEVGTLDSFTIGYGFGGVTRTFADLISIGSDIDQRQSNLERISFLMRKLLGDDQPMLDLIDVGDGATFTYLQRETDAASALDASTFSPFPARLMIMSARRGAVTAFSSITTTADTKNEPVYAGTRIAANRRDVLENVFFTVLMPETDAIAPDERPFLSVRKLANLDNGTNARSETLQAGSGILGIRVAGNSLENMSNLVLLDAKRSAQGNPVSIKTIDGLGNSPLSSVAVVYGVGSRASDIVGIVDSYDSTFFNGKTINDFVTIGSGIDQRQSNLERISYFINKRFDENQDYGQGINVGPSMLDSFSFNDGLTFTYLQRETDATSSLDTSAFSPFPARLMLLSARRGLVTAVSGTTVTADTKDDPVYIGTRTVGQRYVAGDGLETLRNYLIKVADNGDRSTAVSAVTMLDPDAFTVLLRAKLDQGTFDRVDPVTAGSGILGIRVSDNPLENMNMLMLKSAKAGLQSTVSGTTVTSMGGDRLFVGQQYGTIRFSRDPMENISLVTLKTTGIGGGGTSFSVVTSTDVIRPLVRFFLNSGSGQMIEDAVLDEQKAINNYKPLNETSAVSDDSQSRDLQKSVLGDPNDINIVSSGGSLRNTSYADISYFAEDYVGDSRSIF